MSVTPMQIALANMIRGNPDIMDLLPGGVWTRRIKPNEGEPDSPTPGSTPDAFDDRGRLLLCVSILNGEASADLLGPPKAYYAFPEIWIRCLPHDSEKRKLESAATLIIDLLDDAIISIGDGLSGSVKVVGRMMPDDDPDLRPAVVDMIRVQVDSVWSA